MLDKMDHTAIANEQLSAFEELLLASKNVLNNWSSGDLAASVRTLQEAVDRADQS
jgi:hypothetical protein